MTLIYSSLSSTAKDLGLLQPPLQTIRGAIFTPPLALHAAPGLVQVSRKDWIILPVIRVF